MERFLYEIFGRSTFFFWKGSKWHSSISSMDMDVFWFCSFLELFLGNYIKKKDILFLPMFSNEFAELTTSIFSHSGIISY